MTFIKMRFMFPTHSVTKQTKEGGDILLFGRKGPRRQGHWWVTLPSETCGSVLWELCYGLSSPGGPMGSLGQTLDSLCYLSSRGRLVLTPGEAVGSPWSPRLAAVPRWRELCPP